MDSTKIYIVRHGQTEWNVQKRLQGHKDSPLTKLGIQQAEWTRDYMKDIPIDIIYSSTTGRAYKTAQIIRGDRDIPIIAEDDLREINMGNWEGRKVSDIEKEEPEMFYCFWNAPHLYKTTTGETYLDVQKRALKVVKNIMNLHRGKTVLIVTHTTTLKLIMAYFEGRPLSKLWDLPYIHPCSINMVEIKDDEWKIRLHGDISHYKNISNDIEKIMKQKNN